VLGDEVEHDVEVGLAGEQQVLVEGVETLRAHPHLAGGLLGGHVQDRLAAARQRLRGLQQERGLARPRLTAHEHHRAGHEPASEHPVELADAGHRAGVLVEGHVTDRPRDACGA
jgi:hypothetical protein